MASAGGLEGAKSWDPRFILLGTPTAHIVFCFNTTLKIWGFPGRSQEPRKSIAFVVPSSSLDDFLSGLLFIRA